jgi:acyl-CoA reductase-like NAD-dependent aldehyde dehydrogenase
MTSMFQLLIDGVSREGSEGAIVAVVNPATGKAFGEVAYVSAADLDEPSVRLRAVSRAGRPCRLGSGAAS